MAIEQLRAVFANTRRFTKDDLAAIRENAGLIGNLTSHSDWITTRMNAELIDAIRQLDETSTELITTTNRLTAVSLGVAWIVGIATVVGTTISVWQFVRR